MNNKWVFFFGFSRKKRFIKMVEFMGNNWTCLYYKKFNMYL